MFCEKCVFIDVGLFDPLLHSLFCLLILGLRLQIQHESVILWPVMKFLPNFPTFLLLFRFSTSWVRAAAVIDPQAHHLHAPSPVVKRDVTYGNVFSDAAKSSVCTEGQRTILEQCMRDAVQLAKAGADGLAIILDMLTEEKTVFNQLSEPERHRYSETYYTFFGRVEEDQSQWPIFRTRASNIKASLDRLSALTIETWPKSITIYCDSSYYQTADLLGRTADQIPALQQQQQAVVEPGFTFLFDSGSNSWVNTSPKKTNCSDPSTRVDAYTTHRTKVNSEGVSERLDRMVFCPVYFRAIGVVPTAQSFIRPGLSLAAFQRKAERAYVFFFLVAFCLFLTFSSWTPYHLSSIIKHRYDLIRTQDPT